MHRRSSSHTLFILSLLLGLLYIVSVHGKSSAAPESAVIPADPRLDIRTPQSAGVKQSIPKGRNRKEMEPSDFPRHTPEEDHDLEIEFPDAPEKRKKSSKPDAIKSCSRPSDRCSQECCRGGWTCYNMVGRSGKKWRTCCPKGAVADPKVVADYEGNCCYHKDLVGNYCSR
jgi:hypothetical protein